jgi:LasA protease
LLKRIFFFFLLLSGLLLAGACNYPAPALQDHSLSEEELLQTLVPMLLATARAEHASQPAVPSLTPTSAYSPQPTTPASQAYPPTPEPVVARSPHHFYYAAQSGDTLPSLALRFGVNPDEIESPDEIPASALITPGQLLSIPKRLGEMADAMLLLPDSEVIYSPAVMDFDVHTFVAEAGGYLAIHAELVDEELFSGADIVQRVALESSTNPRLLLSILDFRSRWVSANPEGAAEQRYPLGFYVSGQQGLYKELSLAAKQLNIGYYGWRGGTLTDLVFANRRVDRLHPELNAGSVGLQYLFAKFYLPDSYNRALFGESNFVQFHQEMFGDHWERAWMAGPIFPAGLAQPELQLPFLPGERWSFTAGPHSSWGTGTPRGALDFAPITGEPACATSRAWVTASTSGLVTRSQDSLLALDLDGDGFEGTGWVLVYLHLAEEERVAVGTRVSFDDNLGHPSCEGGLATGTHVHIARKYNGEWVAADGPLPFILSGWQAREGNRAYEGFLVKGDQVITANPGGSRVSVIIR